jgi:hypothetical protein
MGTDFITIFISVSQLPGKHKTPGMQVLVQGNQIHLVAAALLGKPASCFDK